MPGGDRTGPLGQGAMTGRGAGYCGGLGRGRGRGFGFRRRALAPYSEKDEAEMLRQEAQYLKTNLDDIQKRLTQLEGQAQKQKEGK